MKRNIAAFTGTYEFFLTGLFTPAAPALLQMKRFIYGFFKYHILKIACYTLILACGWLAEPNVFSQVRNVKAAAGSELSVAGTSSLHNWVIKAQAISCSAAFGANGKGNSPGTLTELSFSVFVNDLKSGNDVMDGRTYSTLKADQYKTISYKLSSCEMTALEKNRYLIKAKGILTIAGVSKEILLQVNCTENADRSILCTGSKVMRMTDFGIEPPSFMMGALTTGDEITVNFSLKLN